jgi:hypothetical protein
MGLFKPRCRPDLKIVLILFFVNWKSLPTRAGFFLCNMRDENFSLDSPVRWPPCRLSDQGVSARDPKSRKTAFGTHPSGLTGINAIAALVHVYQKKKLLVLHKRPDQQKQTITRKQTTISFSSLLNKIFFRYLNAFFSTSTQLAIRSAVSSRWLSSSMARPTNMPSFSAVEK